MTNLAVTCLLQDRAGYIWAGTDNGLFRYDGDRFLGYDRAQGLPSTEIRALAESPEGVLWVATQNGVARLHGTQFVPVDVGESGQFRNIAFDHLGQMYLSHLPGLVRGEPDAAGSYRFRTVVRGAVRGLLVKDNDVWFAKDGDLWHSAREGTERVGSTAGLPADLWDSIAQDSLGNLWVRSSTRLYELVRGKTRFVNRSEGISHEPDSRLYADRHGRMFVSTDSGLVVLDGVNRTTIDSQHGLPASAVGPILVDREESLWLGTLGGSLIRRLGHGEWLSWIKEDGLPHNTVWAILPDLARRVWVGTSSGLTILDPRGRTTRFWTSHNGLAGDRVFAIVGGPTGDVFVGTDPAGISRFNKQGVLLRTYRAESGLKVEQVLALAVDRQQRLWVVGHGGCFRSRNPLDAATELRFEQIDIPGIAAQEFFHDVLVDEGGAVWIATSNGLARFDGSHWRVFSRSDGLKSTDLGAIGQRHGELWLSYRDALGITRLRLNREHVETTHFTRKEGLFSEQIYALAFDSSSRLWATTDNGIDVLEQNQWRHYGRDEGLIWEDTDALALTVDREDNVWVGTSGGMSRFARLPYPIPDSPPPVVLTSISGVSRNWEAGDQPALPYARSSLLIHFSSLSYSYENRTRFRYRLTGYEKGWNETIEKNVHFAGLPAGHYIFEVIAAGPSGLWSPVPARFAFSIKPPWWQSLWFVTACLLLALLAGRIVWELRLRVLKAQRKLLMQQVAERTAELDESHRQLRESHRQLEEIAYCDMLTSLPNRRMFSKQCLARLALARRRNEPFALLLIDLDHFKQINDTCGHNAGDAVLIETAVRLRDAVRESDCVARVGGDEFAILLMTAEDVAGIEAVCKRIVDSLAVNIPAEGSSIKSGCSVGFALFPTDGDTQERLYKSADLALYEVKAAGGNDYCRYHAMRRGIEPGSH